VRAEPAQDLRNEAGQEAVAGGEVAVVGVVAQVGRDERERRQRPAAQVGVQPVEPDDVAKAREFDGCRVRVTHPAALHPGVEEGQCIGMSFDACGLLEVVVEQRVEFARGSAGRGR
jgi:hypothetical protein